MCFQLTSVLLISSLWINFCSQKASGCTSTISQYKRSGEDVIIQFKAITHHSQGPFFIVINQILYGDSTLFTVAYKNSAIVKVFPCQGCTFIGNTDTGNLSIRLDNIKTSGGGTYKHSVSDTSKEVKGCVLLYVLGEPTKPSITVNKVPFEGESVTLTCSSTSTTIPRDSNLRIMYNWNVDGNSPNDTRFTYSDTKNKLTISNIERTDANKQFTCTATENVSNAPTSASSDSKNIFVYYAPTVQPFDIEPVVEGSPLFAECKVDLGIPTDTTFTWNRKLNSSSIIQWKDIPDSSVNESQLLIQNISRNDAGIYKCTASNLMKPTTEAQQMGSSYQTFLVDVLYPTSIISFVVEGHSGKSDVILNENDEEIHLACEVDSKPASTVKIMFKDEVKNEVQDINKLSFKYGSVSCLDGGEYTCEGYNRIGMSSWKTIQLNVNCSPRPLSRINQNISSPLSTDITLSFAALAFPKPGTKNFFWYKRDGDNWTQVLANRNFRIISTALESNLTITNTTKRDYGQYKLIIKNEFGAYTQYFNLVEGKVEKAFSDGDLTTSKHEANTIIVGSVLGTLIAILIGCIVTMIIWYRRKSNRKEQESGDQNQAQTEYVNVSYDPKAAEDSQTSNDRNNTCGTNHPNEAINQYMDLSEYSRDDKSTYDLLHTQQVQN